MPSKNLTIEVPKQDYAPGDVVNGWVIYRVHKKNDAKAIRLQFKGYEYSAWREDQQNARKGVVHQSRNFKLFKHTQPLWVSDSKMKTLTPSEHRFEFVFPIPHDVPASCLHKGGRVRIVYRLKVLVEKGFGSFDSKSFNLVPVGQRFAVDPALPPLWLSSDSAWLMSEPIKMEGSTGLHVVKSGDSLPINLIITNNGGMRSIHGLIVKLKQNWEYGKVKEKVTAAKTEMHEGFPVHKGRHDRTIMFRLPDNPICSTITNAKLIKLTYHVSIHAIVRVGPRPKLHLPLIISTFDPIFINGIALKQQQQQQLVQQPQPQGNRSSVSPLQIRSTAAPPLPPAPHRQSSPSLPSSSSSSSMSSSSSSMSPSSPAPHRAPAASPSQSLRMPVFSPSAAPPPRPATPSRSPLSYHPAGTQYMGPNQQQPGPLPGSPHQMQAPPSPGAPIHLHFNLYTSPAAVSSFPHPLVQSSLDSLQATTRELDKLTIYSAAGQLRDYMGVSESTGETLDKARESVLASAALTSQSSRRFQAVARSEQTSFGEAAQDMSQNVMDLASHASFAGALMEVPQVQELIINASRIVSMAASQMVIAGTHVAFPQHAPLSPSTSPRAYEQQLDSAARVLDKGLGSLTAATRLEAGEEVAEIVPSAPPITRDEVANALAEALMTITHVMSSLQSQMSGGAQTSASSRAVSSPQTSIPPPIVLVPSSSSAASSAPAPNLQLVMDGARTIGGKEREEVWAGRYTVMTWLQVVAMSLQHLISFASEFHESRSHDAADVKASPGSYAATMINVSSHIGASLSALTEAVLDMSESGKMDEELLVQRCKATAIASAHLVRTMRVSASPASPLQPILSGHAKSVANTVARFASLVKQVAQEQELEEIEMSISMNEETSESGDRRASRSTMQQDAQDGAMLARLDQDISRSQQSIASSLASYGKPIRASAMFSPPPHQGKHMCSPAEFERVAPQPTAPPVASHTPAGERVESAEESVEEVDVEEEPELVRAPNPADEFPVLPTAPTTATAVASPLTSSSVEKILAPPAPAPVAVAEILPTAEESRPPVVEAVVRSPEPVAASAAAPRSGSSSYNHAKRSSATPSPKVKRVPEMAM
eukprot:TRINITY_DN355_c0_g1_i5.p1 TRINITY_DN355_c0_g1~~TRINITY_DN355_c0_g1_i5.p1  ORF type:complete len:1106 (+),score=301.03 TRINITY_DN355_c0_g1_i5:206-3523(+)